ncbi:N,N-dimethylformamidase beta subunit family domain-containing protein [Saccharothrix australiensis]|uniref:N,N-dimethylformamidase n=1 Tax=Saccharothrix australiensis TaxID=2072 RepID=A0A495W8N6_9PSEU|nr:N,N-dimethylformamidase beta subunit family domain-containing protein [Saccharothrix australiensis]RKT56128.1 N,N-dimethylformamidase [Saccharothrix australiensis]
MTAALLGYVDPLGVAAGEEVRLMVSATVDYDVALLRLGHGSADARGPGVREEVVERLGSHAARVQPLPSGSYLRAPAHPGLDVDAFTVTAWIMPTMAAGRPRAVVARRDAGGRGGVGLDAAGLDAAGQGGAAPGGVGRSVAAPGGVGQGGAARDGAGQGGAGQGGGGRRGWALGLTADDRLAVWAGAGDAPLAVTDRPVPVGRWTFVAAAFDRTGVRVAQVPVPEWPVGSWRASARHSGPVDVGAAGIEPQVAAWWSGGAAAAHFNGRIDRPTILAGALDVVALGAAVAANTATAVNTAVTGGPAAPVLARWRPGRDTRGATVPDDGPHALHAEAVNTPARGVPGANWTGREIDFRLAPDEYDALHFHDDDLTDARWSPVLTLGLPEDLRSGVYAFRLACGSEQVRVPFFVRPPRGTTTARVAVLIPTFTYLAYANSHSSIERAGPDGPDFPVTPQHRWAAAHKVCSLYDHHRDGSGCYYASRRRPLTTITPNYTGPFGLWNLSADLCLTDWLDHEGVDHDVVCDDDLHAEGVAALAGYDVVLTGSHPEYWTGPMLDAHETYLARGGRVMYLGGNGYYWVTGVSPAAPHVVEIRRGHTGTRGWEVPPGETHLSTTGEAGGLWRHRGRPPQRHVGVGFTAQGGRGRGRPYRPVATAGGRGAFALSGVDGLIDAEALVSGAAAGMEIDRVDHALGSPPHTVVLATADGFDDHFQHAVEEVLTSDSRQGGTVEPRVRADLAFFEYPRGGAVFATGSIAWCTALGVAGYANPVARVTGNVLRRFLDPRPLEDDRSAGSDAAGSTAAGADGAEAGALESDAPDSAAPEEPERPRGRNDRGAAMTEEPR